MTTEKPDATTPAAPNPDLLARVIVLIYGLLEGGKPFWLYAAVKPSQYQPFLKAQKEGKLNLQAFEEYGELIIAGEGQSPPAEVTLKVAEVYQTDPAKFFDTQDPEKAVADKLKEQK